MKKILTFLAILALVCPAQALDRISATITVTNAPTVNGNTFDLNGDTRTWTNNVAISSSQILTNSTIAGVATNFWNHVVENAFAGPVSATFSSSNIIKLHGARGQAMAATIGGAWASVAYVTNTYTTAHAIRVPGSAEDGGIRTNNFSLLTTALDLYSTNSISDTATILANYVSLDEAQTLENKTLDDPTITDGSLTDTELYTLKTLYSTNFDALGFYDSGAAKQYQIAPDANGIPGVYDGTSAASFTPTDASILNKQIADALYPLLSGANAFTGTNTFTRITNSAIVNSSLASATAIGGVITSISDGYWTDAGLSNVVSTNTTFYQDTTLEGAYMTTRSDYTSLASGANSAVDFGDNLFVKIDSGPTADFSIHGIVAGQDGQNLIIYNALAWDMTIADQSGTEATPANRIITLSGGDITSIETGCFHFVYDSEVARWVLINPSGESLDSGNLAIDRFDSAINASTNTFWRGDGVWSSAGTATNVIHVLASTTSLGADHSVSGLTAGMALIANSATDANFRAIAAGDVASGTFADARIALSSITQHINDGGFTTSDFWSGQYTSNYVSSFSFAAASHNHAATDVNSGTFADARISESSVTQHETAIDHDALANYAVGQHRIINDSGTSATELWSASKINTEFGGKSDTGHTHTLANVTDAGTAAALDVPAAGDATTTQVVKGNDTRLTDARTPTSHNHAASEINSGTIADARISSDIMRGADIDAFSELQAHVSDETILKSGDNVSALTNDSGFIASTDLDSFSELQSQISDETIMKSGDNISEFVNDAGYVTAAGTDDQTLVEVLTQGNTTQGADIQFSTATSEPMIMESAGDTYYVTLDAGDLGANRTATFPDATGEVSLLGQTIGTSEVEAGLLLESELDSFSELQSQISDETLVKSGDDISVFNNDAGYLTVEADDQTLVEVLTQGNTTQGADIQFSTATSEPMIMESAGATYYVTLDAGDLSANRTATFPDVTGEVSLLGQSISLTSEVTGTLGAANIDSAITRNEDWDSMAELEAATSKDILDTTELNTFTELQNLVADQTIMKSGDNISAFVNDAGYLTEAGTDDQTLAEVLTEGDTTGANDLKFNNAAAEPMIMESAGATYYVTLDAGDLTQNRTATFPDVTGEVSLLGQYIDLSANVTNTLGVANISSDITRNTDWNTLAKIETATSKDILDTTELNTFTELQSLVSDETLVKSGDNISEFVNDAGYITEAISDDQTLSEVLSQTGGETTGNYDIKFNYPNAEPMIMESVGNTYYVTLDATDLSDDRTVTFSDQTGTVALTSDITTELAAFTGTANIVTLGEFDAVDDTNADFKLGRVMLGYGAGDQATFHHRDVDTYFAVKQTEAGITYLDSESSGTYILHAGNSRLACESDFVKSYVDFHPATSSLDLGASTNDWREAHIEDLFIYDDATVTGDYYSEDGDIGLDNGDLDLGGNIDGGGDLDIAGTATVGALSVGGTKSYSNSTSSQLITNTGETTIVSVSSVPAGTYLINITANTRTLDPGFFEVDHKMYRSTTQIGQKQQTATYAELIGSLRSTVSMTYVATLPSTQTLYYKAKIALGDNEEVNVEYATMTAVRIF